MFRYLVKSGTRRKMLKALWRDYPVSATVRKLAHLTDTPYSQAYDELKAMYAAGLAKRFREGNTLQYSANKDHPHAHLLSQLLALESTTRPAPQTGASLSRDNVFAHLQQMGAPFTDIFTVSESLTAEKTLLEALELAREYPTVARMVPLILYKNKEKLNFDLLLSSANKNYQKRILGFFLELTAVLSKDRVLKKLSEHCYDRRVKKNEFFFAQAHRTKYLEKLTRKHTSALAKKWHYWMNMDLKTFESFFQKFNSGTKTRLKNPFERDEVADDLSEKLGQQK